MPKPITPLVAVDAVIRFKGSLIVLIMRKNPPFRGEFALPGGFVDIGESVEEACIREAYEETNINVKIKKLIGVFSEPNRDPRGHVISVAFLCEPLTDSEEPIAKDDAQALRMVDITDLSHLELAFDHNDIIIASGIIKN